MSSGEKLRGRVFILIERFLDHSSSILIKSSTGTIWGTFEVAELECISRHLQHGFSRIIIGRLLLPQDELLSKEGNAL